MPLWHQSISLLLRYESQGEASRQLSGSDAWSLQPSTARGQALHLASDRQHQL